MGYRSKKREQKDPILHLQIYLAIFVLILFLVEIHTGKVSLLFEKTPDKATDKHEPKQAPGLLTAEKEAGATAAHLEKLSQNHEYELIIKETERQDDIISQAYRALAILESGKHPTLLPQAISFVNKAIREPRLPNNLRTRITKALVNPERQSVTAKENLKAYKEIIEELNIATRPASLKKLRELESEL